MEKSKFFDDLQDMLELDDAVTAETPLAGEDYYDSLTVMGLIAYLVSNLKVKLPGQKLSQVKNVAELMEMIGTEHFK